MAFKLIFSFLFILLLSACDDIARDNVLDPKNPDSYSQPVILVEAFVNTEVLYSDWAIQGLTNLAATYGEDVVIAEYHRDLTGYPDDYNDPSTDQKFTNLHDKYVGQNADIPRSVPDVFINGYENRISGAADANSVNEQSSGIVENLLSQKNYYRIEPIIENNGGGNINVACRIARLANRSAEGLKVRVIFIKDYQQQNLNRVVMEMTLAYQVPTIEYGGYKEVELGDFSLGDSPTFVLIALLSADERIILQCVKQDI